MYMDDLNLSVIEVDGNNELSSVTTLLSTPKKSSELMDEFIIQGNNLGSESIFDSINSGLSQFMLYFCFCSFNIVLSGHTKFTIYTLVFILSYVYDRFLCHCLVTPHKM